MLLQNKFINSNYRKIIFTILGLVVFGIIICSGMYIYATNNIQPPNDTTIIPDINKKEEENVEIVNDNALENSEDIEKKKESDSTEIKIEQKSDTKKESNQKKSDNNSIISKSNQQETSKDTVKPVLSGISNKTIEFGEGFNAMSGVSANDNCDGNITNKINVSGTVNNSVVGNYTLTYSVIDNAGNESSASRIITVNKKPDSIIHQTSLETQLFNEINSYRSNNGLKPITFSNNQYSKANSLTSSKATSNNLDSSHYANEICIVYGGNKPSAGQLLQMWINSPSHNEFLLGSRKNYGGCAVYSNGNNYYVILEARIDDR